MTHAWSTIFPIALLPLIFHWMPLWRRNGIWFGVTVAPGYEDCPQARTVLHSYRIAIWLLALAAIAVTAFGPPAILDRKSTRLNSSHLGISYAVFCLKKKNNSEADRCLHLTSDHRSSASA